MSSAERGIGEAPQALNTSFLVRGGEMGERIRLHDWSATRVGPIIQLATVVKFGGISLCKIPLSDHYSLGMAGSYCSL